MILTLTSTLILLRENLWWWQELEILHLLLPEDPAFASSGDSLLHLLPPGRTLLDSMAADSFRPGREVPDSNLVLDSLAGDRSSHPLQGKKQSSRWEQGRDSFPTAATASSASKTLLASSPQLHLLSGLILPSAAPLDSVHPLVPQFTLSSAPVHSL